MRRLAIIPLMGFLFTTNIEIAQAKDPYPIIKKQGEVQEQLSSLSTRMDQLNKEFYRLKENKSKVEFELTKSTNAIKEKTKIKENTLKQVNNLKVDIHSLNIEYYIALEKFNARANVLKKRLSIMQGRNQTIDYISVLLDSKSLSNLFNRITAMTIFVDADKELLKQTLADQEEISKKKEELEKVQKKLDQEQNLLTVQLNEIESEKNKQSELLIQIQEQQSKVVLERREMEEKNASLLEEQQNLAKQLSLSVNPTSINFSSNEVPTEYLPYYISSGEKYGVDWPVLAAIHSTETTYSTDPDMVSSAGAIGHMQFLVLTWIGYSYDSGNGQPAPDIDITDPNVIKRGNGYGTDADGDGKADPYNLADSIESAAKYLSKNGYAMNPARAIWHYNHAQWYVDEVLIKAKLIKEKYEPF
ncbi:hypothetical protein LIS82_27405 (plasmid) [Cytobacillus solani]|uniref:PcsB-like coiled-coil domain-containing protein n=1 Tax=Cytobacillus solani TaxID=1637975 RepID=UPI002079B66E|nr:hypothetical protein [Cytobacillus solani]USK57707.1 hypothetical protein LIS82_27405 [Cytobacillus solani]